MQPIFWPEVTSFATSYALHQWCMQTATLMHDSCGFISHINSCPNSRVELSELRQFVGVETPPQRLTDAEPHWQIARERASSDSLVQFRFYQLIGAGWKRDQHNREKVRFP
jgi:hypothetical protein